MSEGIIKLLYLDYKKHMRLLNSDGYRLGLKEGGENPFDPDQPEYEDFWDGCVDRSNNNKQSGKL